MFDQTKADRALRFISSLKHTKGEWHGKPFDLLPWQHNDISNVFGTLNERGYRQYRVAYTEVPKKQGKSELGAGVALKLTCADDEWAAEVYGCASDRQQASIVFDVAVDMVDQWPKKIRDAKIKLVLSQRVLIYKPTKSFYKVLSSEAFTKHGLNVHGCIFDELHTQPNRELWDVMTQMSGDARRQPLVWAMTTAGTDRNSICYEVHQKARDILDGKRPPDPSFYPVIYGIDDNDDWLDEKNWYKANPSLGITIDIDRVRLQAEQAKQNPMEENLFRQLRLNQWVKQSVRWIPMHEWNKCSGAYTREQLIEKLAGCRCFGGLDLSSTVDLSAFVLCFPPDESREIYPDKYIFLSWQWLPGVDIKRREEQDHVPYQLWNKGGYIKHVAEPVIDYIEIENKILELAEKYEIVSIGYDPHKCEHTRQAIEPRLADHNTLMVKIPQEYRHFHEPSTEYHRLIMKNQIIHANDPALRWNADNCHIMKDTRNLIKPVKEHANSTQRIDGLVASVMALSEAMIPPEDQTSVYEERGVIAF